MASLGLHRLLDRVRESRQTPLSARNSGQERPDALPESRSVVVVVLDSCRFDTFVKAGPRWAEQLGQVEQRFSYATWTAPSHHNLLMGLLPHTNPPRTHASQVYRAELENWGMRLGLEHLDTGPLLPGLWLPDWLRAHLGYRTTALVSMPVLHPATPLSRGFDTWRLMPTHNDMGAIVDDLRFYEERPVFALLNLGETHYPYAATGDEDPDLPRLHGLRGVAKSLDARLREGELVSAPEAPAFFNEATMKRLHDRQVEALKSLDTLFEALFDRVPPGTWITVTADHGELFGEQGFFGHGPIQHPKVMEVPFVEGRIR